MTTGDRVRIVRGRHAGKLATVERAWHARVRVRIRADHVGDGPKAAWLEPDESKPLSVIDQLAALASQSTKNRVKTRKRSA